MVNRGKVDPEFNRSEVASTRFQASPATSVAVSAWNVNFLSFALNSPASVEVGGKILPSVAIAGSHNLRMDQLIYPDFRMDPATIPVVDAKALLAGNAPTARVVQSDVFLTSTNPDIDTAVGYLGRGRVPGAMMDIAGMEGASKGKPMVLGSQALLAFFSALVLLGQRLRPRWAKLLTYSVLTLGLLVMPGLLRGAGVILDLGPAFIAALAYAPLRSSQKWRRRMQLTNNASGLPNIGALAAQAISRSDDVVAVSVSQYEQMLASLPQEFHGECARQIARRLSLGAGDREIFDNDNGHFVWIEDSKPLDTLIEHLEGLKALFSSPLVIHGHVLDTNIHFGLDRNIESKPISRIQSALASATEAQGKGKLYEEFGQQRLAQSSWELSLHARIDAGLRNGDIWLALQPQYDFRNGRISGAEALIRWDDPERGAIPPDAFILQAERVGRIDKITYWVLEKSIAMARELNRIAGPFQISVNLSARLVDHPALVQRIADIVRETKADCSLITFEITETFSMANRAEAKRNLSALRAMGFRLSIDDFGTGQASLAYLAEIPSDEIKLDRRFVQAITTDERERIIVDSVIKLAHALGQEVVAEGIEDGATLEALRQLGCDLAQGYHIGRPMKFAQLTDLVGLSQLGTEEDRAANN
jgi:EAL domain-containing protein (putative c-di-GMP-specific phosphodiesterase class I)